MTSHTFTNTQERHSSSRARCPRITFEYYIPICREISVATCRSSSASASSSKTIQTDLYMTSHTLSNTQERRFFTPYVDLGCIEYEKF